MKGETTVDNRRASCNKVWNAMNCCINVLWGVVYYFKCFMLHSEYTIHSIDGKDLILRLFSAQIIVFECNGRKQSTIYNVNGKWRIRAIVEVALDM